MLDTMKFWLTCGSLMAASPLWANIVTFGAESADFGVYCAVEADVEVPAEGTISGVVNLVTEPPVFQRRTNLVPARIGIGFGVHLMVLPEYQGQIVVQTTHPPMGPDGITRESWVTEVAVGRMALHGFSFEYDYEMVRGDWSISASVDGRLIYHADFIVVDPATVPPINCTGQMLS
jgi:hypothetical protein